MYVADADVLELVELVETMLVVGTLVLVVTLEELNDVEEAELDVELETELEVELDLDVDVKLEVELDVRADVITTVVLEVPTEIVAVAEVLVTGTVLVLVPEPVREGAGQSLLRGLLIGRMSRMPLMMPDHVVSS